MAEQKDSVGQLAHKPITQLTSLTTPCSVTALHNWIQQVYACAPGEYPNTQVTTTATSISIA